MPNESLAEAVSELRRHYADVVVPIWRNRGFDPRLRLPLEAVMIDAEPVSTRFRAMACARQLYIFSELGDREHADRLFGSLNGYFRDMQHGGFFYSVNASGEPLETNKDLYTHAFVIFACAAYLIRFGVVAARSLINETNDIVTSRFSKDSSTGLMNAVVSADFSSVHTSARQNPLMHLTEAWLLAKQAGSGDNYDTLLDTMLSGITTYFIEPQSACIMELPVNEAENWLEPGHQFEWFYLSEYSRHTGFSRTGLSASLKQAFTFARMHGVDHKTGGVAAALSQYGTVLDDTQRIWAQTEYIRALACHPDPSERAKLPMQIHQFRLRFLRNTGWNECISPTGEVKRIDMPSTTPYHLACAYSALPNPW